MRIAPVLAASVVAIGLSVSGTPSQAAQLSPLQQLQQSHLNQSQVEQVGYRWRRGRCVRWRHVCAHRWGWGGPRFRRCVIRHGC